MHRNKNTQYAHNMQHKTTQNTPDTPDTEHSTEQDTETNNPAQPQHTSSAHNYRTYSLDYYFEFAYIKNSNTIELYTISKENIQKTLITSLYSFDFIVLRVYQKTL